MSLTWIHEPTPLWNADRQRIVGGAPPGVFTLDTLKAGEVVPGEWWRVEDDGRVVGYGWMDYSWGDAEVLVAVDPDARAHGIGSFIFDRLEDEAGHKGINYMYNVVPDRHPDPAALKLWLMRRSFVPSHEGGLLKRRVHKRGD
ncbi:MAG: GNAT family N-acetyltransferase [Vicinamibacterales bacterium]